MFICGVVGHSLKIVNTGRIDSNLRQTAGQRKIDNLKTQKSRDKGMDADRRQEVNSYQHRQVLRLDRRGHGRYLLGQIRVTYPRIQKILPKRS